MEESTTAVLTMGITVEDVGEAIRESHGAIGDDDPTTASAGADDGAQALVAQPGDTGGVGLEIDPAETPATTMTEGHDPPLPRPG
jgi:hypothetical protein